MVQRDTASIDLYIPIFIRYIREFITEKVVWLINDTIKIQVYHVPEAKLNKVILWELRLPHCIIPFTQRLILSESS